MKTYNQFLIAEMNTNKTACIKYSNHIEESKDIMKSGLISDDEKQELKKDIKLYRQYRIVELKNALRLHIETNGKKPSLRELLKRRH